LVWTDGDFILVVDHFIWAFSTLFEHLVLCLSS
jgi:hypothetical protein